MDFLRKVSPRHYQEVIFSTCVEKNCLVVLPTGLGKTLIALMLVIERMKKFPGEKAVFLAPTRPLAEQHFLYFRENLPELFKCKFPVYLFMDGKGIDGKDSHKRLLDTEDEFTIDFIYINPDPPFGKLQSRIITSPGHAKRFLMALQENITKYENNFGEIKVPTKPPGDIGYLQ